MEKDNKDNIIPISEEIIKAICDMTVILSKNDEIDTLYYVIDVVDGIISIDYNCVTVGEHLDLLKISEEFEKVTEISRAISKKTGNVDIKFSFASSKHFREIDSVNPKSKCSVVYSKSNQTFDRSKKKRKYK